MTPWVMDLTVGVFYCRDTVIDPDGFLAQYEPLKATSKPSSDYSQRMKNMDQIWLIRERSEETECRLVNYAHALL